MQYQVSDVSSHRRDQIANFAEILSHAPAKRQVFEAIYRGKRSAKTVLEIADATGYTTKRVTELAKPLARQGLFEQGREEVDGRAKTVYKKIHFVTANRAKILRLNTPSKLSGYHTKTNPKIIGSAHRVVIRALVAPKTTFVRVDDIQQFKAVKKIKVFHLRPKPARLSEKQTKKGILKLLGEPKNPKDWGGESNDIFTTRLTLHGKSRRAAFALKGPSKKGPLVPAKMGKNGDQVQRLFDSPAEVFFVQYEGEIAQSVIGLMENLARAKALLSKEVFYGVIDREDTYRLRVAYPKKFATRF